jgi:aminoglycoside phosphotransferase
MLTGESEFTEQGASHDFRQFYDTRIKILKKASSKGPKARLQYEELMRYFNENLFPSEDMMEPEVDEEEAMLLQAISDGEEGSAEDENEH